MAGLIAGLTGHSFVQLGLHYPSRGGVVEYLVRGFGPGVLSGSLSVLYYFAQLIASAMLGLAFGRFVSELFSITSTWASPLVGSALMITLCSLQLFGSALMFRIQQVFVVVNLLVLLVLACGLLAVGDAGEKQSINWPGVSSLASSISLTFFAFTGFAVINNSIEQMTDRRKELPFAVYGTIGIAAALYLLIAFGVLRAVEHHVLVTSGPLLLVEAGSRAFGSMVSQIILLSAAIATVTCINSGLYSMTNISYSLAEKGELPARFGRKIQASTRGLTISALLSIILMNTIDLTAIASVGSAVILVIYTLVNVCALRLPHFSLSGKS